MKTIALTFVIIFSSILSFAQENKSITVTIDNVKNNKEKVILTLHNENTFLVKSNGLNSIETVIENRKIKATFKNIAPGTYAILVMHDVNENKEMDFDTNRMPLEDYGMSNNPLSYGPPQYK
ncbi:MAG: DUF2141 domain-containing protein [Lacinutrix sp.]|uniref:DUF2141 domain-containing protein n=1 Tax=Lacinutrix sp. TaxID=1937692 RepID=UPI0030A365C3